MKIAIAVPTNRGIKAKTLKSLMELDCPHEKHIIVAMEGYTTAENRIYTAIQSLKNGCTHLFTVDDDMIFPPETLTKMLSHNKDIVGVVAHSRALPPLPVVEFLDDSELSTADKLLGRREIPTELFEAKAVGGGVLLIKTDVFNKIEKPWFGYETYDFGMTKMGEDSWFCNQASKAGFKIYVDPTITIGHIGDYIY